MDRTALSSPGSSPRAAFAAVATRALSTGRRATRPVFTAAVRARAARCGTGLTVNGWSQVSPTTELGDDVHFNGMRIAGCGRVVIGDHFHSGRDCLMISQVHDYDGGDRLPYGDRVLPRDIVIGDNVWLGDRVIVLGGARIGDGAIIQAGSVVVGEIPPLAIAGGHPARPFAERDAEHYHRLCGRADTPSGRDR